jgi:hypothetical protein
MRNWIWFTQSIGIFFGVILKQSLFSKGRGRPYVHELEGELGRRRMNLKVAW